MKIYALAVTKGNDMYEDMYIFWLYNTKEEPPHGGGGSSFAFGVAGFTVDGIARFCCIFRCLPPSFVADFTLTYNLS